MNVHKYKEVVEHVQSIYKDALLVGGAIRDTIFNVPVKDLDFVTTFNVTEDNLKEVWPDLEFEKLGGADKEEYDNGDGLIQAIWGSTDGSINVINVDHIGEYIDSFPDSISKVWYNGRFVDHSHDWLQTIIDGTVEYAPHIQSKRLDKLKSKYPDMEFTEKKVYTR